jgi:hypothetical protein
MFDEARRRQRARNRGRAGYGGEPMVRAAGGATLGRMKHRQRGK